jgi:ribonuclease HI
MKKKFYVVWQGNHPGVYDSWEACLAQVKGFAGAQYKSYKTRDEAEEAFKHPYAEAIAKPDNADDLGMTVIKPSNVPPPVLDSIAVDAACSGNPGVMEYQGVYVASRTKLFHYKYPVGTNNIGEFLALVHGLSYLKKHNLNQILYSDSVNAISWVRQKKCKSKLVRDERTEVLWQYVERAEDWLKNNTYTTEIRKWDTHNWGEIPADFGRK